MQRVNNIYQHQMFHVLYILYSPGYFILIHKIKSFGLYFYYFPSKFIIGLKSHVAINNIIINFLRHQVVGLHRVVNNVHFLIESIWIKTFLL